jgi:hypothetical protein
MGGNQQYLDSLYLDSVVTYDRKEAYQFASYVRLVDGVKKASVIVNHDKTFSIKLWLEPKDTKSIKKEIFSMAVEFDFKGINFYGDTWPIPATGD